MYSSIKLTLPMSSISGGAYRTQYLTIQELWDASEINQELGNLEESIIVLQINSLNFFLWFSQQSILSYHCLQMILPLPTSLPLNQKICSFWECPL